MEDTNKINITGQLFKSKKLQKLYNDRPKVNITGQEDSMHRNGMITTRLDPPPDFSPGLSSWFTNVLDETYNFPDYGIKFNSAEIFVY